MVGGLAGSSSMPALPSSGVGARGRAAGSSSLAELTKGGRQPGEVILRLKSENDSLQADLLRAKANFSKAFIKDIRSPSRRRLEPMRKLIQEQSLATSELVTKAGVKQQRVDHMAMRVLEDNSVQERRMQDVLQLQRHLE